MLRDEDQMGGDTMSNHRNLFIFTFHFFLAVAVLGSALHSPGLCPPPATLPTQVTLLPAARQQAWIGGREAAFWTGREGKRLRKANNILEEKLLRVSVRENF